MLECSDGYKSAIVGDTRRMYIKAVLEILDPDIVYGAVDSNGAAAWSKPAQLTDKEMEAQARYATLEHNRWLLDGSFRLIPNDPAALTGQVGFVGDGLSGADGTFAVPVYVEQRFSSVSVLQACSVYFSQDAIDGVAADFTVAVRSNGQDIYTREFTGNTAVSVSLDGFTVYDPDAIRITVTRWSLPGRRPRTTEIVPGLYEAWTEDVLASLEIQMRGNFACLALPYNTCTVRMDNLDRRFEPRFKSGIFRSIEDRQGIQIAIGTRLKDGSKEYKRAGIFYQTSGGFSTSDNDISMEWSLVDIVGLVADREFIWEGDLPTVLSGWLAAIVGQLGANFANRWHVDPAYGDLPVTANDPADVLGKKCGDLLRFACMATGTWPRADAETGDLTAEPLWSQGNKVTLENLVSYPTMRDNDALAALIFKLYDGAGTTDVISGNATSSSKTLTVSNPFIHTHEQALTAARQILSQYGGLKLETTGRGDPASEIGDVDTVWLDESSAAAARRMEQSFHFSGGVLRDCKSVLLQADGSFLFTERQVFTESGVCHIPPGVDRVRLILVPGGQGGSRGADGHVGGSGNLPGSGVSSGQGDPGLDGAGGKVWQGVVNVNPDTDYAIQIGQGGAPSDVFGVPGALGGATTFGVYSSDNGELFPYGFSDLASGDSYGRTGVEKPLPGTGDGGRGGEGGEAGQGYWRQLYWTQSDVDSGRHPGTTIGGGSIVGHSRGWEFVVTKKPGKGKPGVAGASGLCVISWDKP